MEYLIDWREKDIARKKRIAKEKKLLKKFNKRIRKKRIGKKKLKKILTPNYTEYIHSKRWRQRRLDYYTRHKKECWICKSKHKVGLHHITYKNLGNEKDADLIALCWNHHGELHRLNGYSYTKSMLYIEQEKQAIEFLQIANTL